MDGAIRAALDSGGSYRVEARVVNADGRQWVMSARGEVSRDEEDGSLRLCSTVQDITEWKRAEERLRESERRYRDLFEHAPDAIILAEPAGGEIVGANRAAAELTGRSREALVGMRQPELHPGGSGEEVFSKLVESPDGTARPVEAELARADGTLVPVESVAQEVRHGGRAVIQSTVRDISQRKRAEAALRESEERFRTVVTNIQAVVFMTDAEGVFELCEGRALSTLGLAPGELEGQSVFERFRDYPQVIEGFRRALAGEGNKEVVEVRDAVFDVFHSALRDRQWNITGVIGVAVDITDQEEAKHKLIESERYYSSIFSSIQDGISVLDSDMNIVRTNEAMERWFPGKTPLVGKKCFHVYHNRDEPCEVCPVRKTMETLGPAYEVVPKRDDEGNVIGWFDLYSFPLFDEEGGELEGVIEYVRDITQQQKALQELKQSEENYRALFQESPLPLAIHRDGVIIDVNRAGAELIGADSPEELIGRQVIDFVHPDYREIAIQRMKQLAAGGGKMGTVEEKFVKLDGSVIDVEVTAMPVNYRGERAVQVAVTDVTERKQLEEQLRQAQKMEGIGTLTGGIAHDFNNFLTAIEGYIDLSLMDLPEDSPVREELVEARRSAERAADLTQQLLLFGRREPMDLKPTDFSRVVLDMQKMLDRLIGERYQLKTQLKKSIWTVKADAGHLEQVIMNLVVNARDSMPEGGVITISTDNVVVDEEYARTHANSKAGEFVCLEVRDQG